MRAEIHYGKAEVSAYRTYARPLEGVTPIPESAFTGRPNVLMAAEIDVQVLGESFLEAYTHGDNTNVVPTDTMKNFIHRQSLAFAGSTLEGWLFFVGGRFLETYPQMERLRVSAQALRFDAARVPVDDSGGENSKDARSAPDADADAADGLRGRATPAFRDSDKLFHRRHDDRGIAALEIDRAPDGTAILRDLRCGRAGMQLIKVTGSAFASFPRDAFTTLPERRDRPLFIHLDVAWRYADPMIAVEPEAAQYVASEQIADLVTAVFDRFVSLSIQHLVHEMGTRILERFPQLVEVSLEAQNRLWDSAEVSEEDERLKVYTDPRPPYGRIGLTLRRDEA